MEERVFFYKMVGDYNRYASESASSDDTQKRLPGFKTGALESYSKALQLCKRQDSGIEPHNPVRLGLALNFSVFHYEIMQDAKSASMIARDALESAVDNLDQCDEDKFTEAQSIIELLKENLNIWCEEVEIH